MSSQLGHERRRNILKNPCHFSYSPLKIVKVRRGSVSEYWPVACEVQQQDNISHDTARQTSIARLTREASCCWLDCRKVSVAWETVDM
ncbi:hypothetical protein E2C01_014357 [Portunus trituberculatus]|uniref:Uncharacterized protein n=1 Tax=Portunus trituberculatus TaxID=210409 RepID=A0A5B7DJU6_PORTR|nr:hypothetical protein [Portunus trituberculatus]